MDEEIKQKISDLVRQAVNEVFDELNANGKEVIIKNKPQDLRGLVNDDIDKSKGYTEEQKNLLKSIPILGQDIK